MNLHIIPLLALLLLSSTSFADKPELSINGILKLDQLMFSEKNRPEDRPKFYNGAFAPSALLMFTAKYSPSMSAYAELDLLDSPNLGLGYLQLNEISGSHTSLMLGQVPSPFCLEMANSGKNVPFLYRSLAVSAFTPCTGPGANFRIWHETFVLNMAANQMAYGKKQTTPADDRWGGSARVVAKPLVNERNLIHIGASASYQAQRDEVTFKTAEIRGRNLPDLITITLPAIKEYRVFGGEAAARLGSLQVESDYLVTQVKPIAAGKDTIKFSGWAVQGNYFLSGEIRDYTEETASFAGPKTINSPDYGAWQVALRTSQVTLNDRDIHGGKQLDNSIALNWYVTKHVKVTLNYIHAQIWPHAIVADAKNDIAPDAPPTAEDAKKIIDPDKRTVHMIGMRLQTTW